MPFTVTSDKKYKSVRTVTEMIKVVEPFPKLLYSVEFCYLPGNKIMTQSEESKAKYNEYLLARGTAFRV